jgi:dolichyl-diphosphooligosaccharide--protein glycosyltransferase
MSNWREQFEDESVFDAFTALFVRYYHYVVLAALVAFAFWNRARNWQNYVVGGEILFRGNDPWYHYRSTQYVVNNFPQTMPFEPWTGFPQGTAQSQFGTILDQVVGLTALVVGLGSPSEELVKQISLFTPAVIGALIAVPTYLICRRVGGRFAGVVGVAILAFAADRLLSLSVAGFYDHHVAEAFTQAFAVLSVMVALHVAEREKPVYELVTAREFDALRRPLGWALLAGFAINLYLAVWPPGVLLLGILGTFFVIHLSIEYLRGRSPEHAAFVSAVALGTAGILQLSTVNAIEINATSRSLLQPGLALAVAFGVVFMAWLARRWDARSLTKYAYPPAVLGLIVLSAGIMAVALPGLFDFFVNQVLRVVGFQTSPTAGTIGEAQPLRPGRLYDFYRLALFTAFIGAVVLLIKQYIDDEPRGEHLLVVVWSVFILAAVFTQSRFGYYLTVPIAALNAAFIGGVMNAVGGIDESLEIEAYQVFAVGAVLMVVIVPLFAFGAGPVRSASAAQNPGGVVGWQDSLDWMEDNTPAEGQYANASAEPMEYYGAFERTDDFDYPPGAYGVMSWWDYGHWITVLGESIPNANPFQQNARDAARYLLTQNETQSEQVLDDIDEDDAHTRYVMVDWKMVQAESLNPVRGKFFAPPTFVDGVGRSTYFTRVLATDQLRQAGLFRSTLAIRHKQTYYNSTMVRLYLYHGSAKSPEPYVVDWQGQERPIGNGETFVSPPRQGPPVKVFENMSAARSFAENDDTATVGGFGPHPSERVPALKHYRLVHMSEVSALDGGGEVAAFRRAVQQSGLGRQLQTQLGEDAQGGQLQQEAIQRLYPNTPAWTKTFERVDGATIEGTAPENASLRIRVQLNPENGVPFVYSQRVQADSNGEFSTTVPYSTTGYDEVGPEEGYTDTNVRATGPYVVTSAPRLNTTGSIVRYTGTVNVTERQVVGADDSPATVELESRQVGQIQNPNSDGNGDGGGESGGQSLTAPGRNGVAAAEP